MSAPLCGKCSDGWLLNPDTLLPADRCPCRHRTITPQQARDHGTTTTVEANPQAMRAALAIIRDAATRLPELSANDVRTEMRIAQVPGPVVGAAFAQAVKDKALTPTGYVPSTDAATHGHPVRSYESRIYRAGRTA